MMEINKTNILEITNFLKLNPKKELGQNFLVDPKVCLNIANQIPNGKILEVGPGLGSLTHFILDKGDVTVIDLDTRMTNFLFDQYGKTSLNIINQDILKSNVSTYEYICGNLPYYITTDIITYLLKNATNCKKMVFMIQKEAYPRFSATIKDEAYCPISILISMMGNIKKLFNVSPNSFFPNPHVDSVVFEINILNRNEEIFNVYQFAKAMFLNRRKTILNNLDNYLKNKTLAMEALKTANIEPNRRPEKISVEEFKKLYSLIRN